MQWELGEKCEKGTRGESAFLRYGNVRCRGAAATSCQCIGESIHGGRFRAMYRSQWMQQADLGVQYWGNVWSWQVLYMKDTGSTPSWQCIEKSIKGSSRWRFNIGVMYERHRFGTIMAMYREVNERFKQMQGFRNYCNVWRRQVQEGHIQNHVNVLRNQWKEQAGEGVQ